MISSCLYIDKDVSSIPPHNQLVNSVWKLKTDAYIVVYKSDPNYLFLVPCSSKLGHPKIGSQWLPDRSIIYKETNIGRVYDQGYLKVIGGLRKGELIKINKVVDSYRYGIGFGSVYLPMVTPIKSNQITQSKNISLELYYSNGSGSLNDFCYKGILNPEYAERVK